MMGTASFDECSRHAKVAGPTHTIDPDDFLRILRD
jgi:hypothetical protein